MGNQRWAEEFFSIARRASKAQQRSTTDTLLEVIAAAEMAADRGSKSGVRVALKGLRTCVDLLRPQLDDAERGRREYEAALQYMTIRKQNLDLQLMVATLTHNDVAAADIRGWIDEMTPFFDAAIADLDGGEV